MIDVKKFIELLSPKERDEAVEILIQIGHQPKEEPEPWPQAGDSYFYLNSVGVVLEDYYDPEDEINDLHETVNFFKTHEDAKASALYTLLNSEYNYWIPGTDQPKPLNWDELEVEKYHHVDKEWNSHEYGCHDSSLYRWKKAGQ